MIIINYEQNLPNKLQNDNNSIQNKDQEDDQNLDEDESERIYKVGQWWTSGGVIAVESSIDLVYSADQPYKRLFYLALQDFWDFMLKSQS